MKFLSRLWIVLPLVLVVVGSAEAQTVKVNDEFTGKFPAQPVKALMQRGGPGNPLYLTSLTVDLKQDQEVAITLAVEGDRRALAIALLDKNGVEVGTSFLPTQKSNGDKGPTDLQRITGSFAALTSPNGGIGGKKLELAKTAVLKIDKARLAGPHTILVMSDTASEYTLNVVDEKADKPAKPKRDAAAVEKELKQLKQRIEADKARIGELEKELKDLEKAPAKIGK